MFAVNYPESSDSESDDTENLINHFKELKKNRKRRKTEYNRGRYRPRRTSKRLLQECTCNSRMCYQPVEIIINIFRRLPPKDLIACRQVCYRWKLIIDNCMTKIDSLWYQHSKKEFKDAYDLARLKSNPDMTTYDIYRSLKVWSKLKQSKVTNETGIYAPTEDEELRNFVIIENGIVGIHSNTSIVYYDIETMKVADREPIEGRYLRYRENAYMIALMTENYNLILIRKKSTNHPDEDTKFTVDAVRLFTLKDNLIYIVTLLDNLYVCDFNQSKLSLEYIKHAYFGVSALAVNDGIVDVLTYHLKIYSIIDGEEEPITYLEGGTNIFNTLYVHNFYEYLDSRIYHQWKCFLNNPIPTTPLSDVIIIRPYGNVVFLGTFTGLFSIYYKPFKEDGEFNFSIYKPIKHYTFMNPSHRCNVPRPNTILQVDAYENKGEHIVLVALRTKCMVLKFKYDFTELESVSVR